MTNLSIALYAYVVSTLTSLRERENGQDLLEYAMLGGLIALSILLVLGLLTGALQNMIKGIGNCIDFNNTSACTPGF